MKKLLFLFIALVIYLQVDAQRVYDTTTVDLMGEFLKVQDEAVGTKADSVRRHAIIYQTEDIDTVTTSSFGYIWIYIKGDSIIYDDFAMGDYIIQNAKCRLSIYTSDSMIVVQKPEPSFKLVMRIDITDSVFQQFAMQSITAADSGNFRKLTIHFEDDAPFITYQLSYRKTDYKINYIYYVVKKEFDSKTSAYRKGTFVGFSDYEYRPADWFNFSTDSYINVISPTDIRTSTSTVNWDIINLLNQ